jgi:hypothetical protein
MGTLISLVARRLTHQAVERTRKTLIFEERGTVEIGQRSTVVYELNRRSLRQCRRVSALRRGKLEGNIPDLCQVRRRVRMVVDKQASCRRLLIFAGWIS